MPNYVDCVKVSDEDLDGTRLPAIGTAKWVVNKVEGGTSKRGDPKTTVTYKIVDEKGEHGILIEDIPMLVKFRVARMGSATGTGEMVKEGRVDIDQWVGKTGRGVIEHKKSPGYPDKAVWQYFLREGQEAPAPTAAVADEVDAEFNDDVPF